MSDTSGVLHREIIHQLFILLKAVPSLHLEKMMPAQRINGMWFATVMLLTNGQWQREVRVKNLANGQPKAIRQTILEWYSLYPALGDESPYLMIGVPYLSDRGLEICKEMNVGCIDTAGNCYIRFGTVYIEISGRPNPKPDSRDEASIFSPKSSRVARVLLSDIHKWWRVQEIAETAGISIGLASRIKTRLVEQALAEDQKQGVRVSEPQALLSAWLEHYTYRKNSIREFYTLDSPAEAEHALVDYCRTAGIRCALGLFSGAARVAPHVRMNKAFAFVDADLDEIAGTLGWEHVTSGANVALLAPYDDGVFLFNREIQECPVVSDIQLYLDLKRYKGRGEEAAEFLLRTTIQPEWQHEKNTDR